MKTKLLTIGLLLFAAFANYYLAFGQCSCAFVTPDSKYVEIIFTGKVLSDDKGKYKIQVIEIFKGLDRKEIVEAEEGRCNSARDLNKEYLFMAVRDEKTKEIKILGCSYSYENIDKQRQFIEILRWKKKGGNQGGLLVGIVGGNYDKSDGVNYVYVEGENGEKFEVKIQDDGFYKLENLKPGNYKVYLKLPETLITYGDIHGFEPYKSVRYLSISDNDGAIADFSISVNGIISGKVLNENNSPVISIEVNLYYIDETGKVTLAGGAETDYNGYFAFKGLWAGKYFIKVGTEDWYIDPTSKNIAFPLTYFPNVREKVKAEIIKLEKAQVLKEKNIALTTLKKRLVAGQVFYEDNRPAVNAKISVQVKRENDGVKMRSGRYVLATTDSNGFFSFFAYGETDYLFRAAIWEYTSSSSVDVLFSSECIVLPKNDEINPLKIVLKKGYGNCEEKKYGF